ncbi:trypsin-like peptidase domain-containing protein [Agrobacterium rhizogenes]|nr:trypsin-like peptidase domain-containing protein [Rhizobium rhizogenes]
MPHIPSEHLQSIATLYGPHPKSGALHPQGTSFLVDWRDDITDQPSTYLVSCDHCYSTTHVRFAHEDLIELDKTEWKKEPSGSDIMAMDVTEILPASLSKYTFVNLAVRIGMHDRGLSSDVGDEIYLLGLHADENDAGNGHPRARFGNISAWADPNYPIEQGNRHAGQSHIGDMRSRGGFSGSPVFAYRESDDWNDSPRPRLLGVHSGQFKERIPVAGLQETYATLPSSLTIIVPAWNLEFIETDADFARCRHLRNQSS